VATFNLCGDSRDAVDTLSKIFQQLRAGDMAGAMDTYEEEHLEPGDAPPAIVLSTLGAAIRAGKFDGPSPPAGEARNGNALVKASMGPRPTDRELEAIGTCLIALGGLGRVSGLRALAYLESRVWEGTATAQVTAQCLEAAQ